MNSDRKKRLKIKLLDLHSAGLYNASAQGVGVQKIIKNILEYAELIEKAAELELAKKLNMQLQEAAK